MSTVFIIHTLHSLATPQSSKAPLRESKSQSPAGGGLRRCTDGAAASGLGAPQGRLSKVFGSFMLGLPGSGVVGDVGPLEFETRNRGS